VCLQTTQNDKKETWIPLDKDISKGFGPFFTPEITFNTQTILGTLCLQKLALPNQGEVYNESIYFINCQITVGWAGFKGNGKAKRLTGDLMHFMTIFNPNLKKN